MRVVDGHKPLMKHPSNLWELWRCPLTGQTLCIADADLLAQANIRIVELRSAWNNELFGRDESTMTATLTAALIREDRTVIYPIHNGIPVLLEEAAITL